MVNKWASWCRPCRAEFPIFQQVATKRGKQVAFLGVNGADKRPAAEKFLAQRPLPYPSYEDPDEDIAQELKVPKFFPMTRVPRRERQDRVHQVRRVHVARRARGRHRPVPRLNVSELRVDPLTGLKTIIAAARADRPGGHFDLDPPPPIDAESDPFALGHEDQTPPEVYAVRPNGGGPDTPGLDRPRRAEPVSRADPRRAEPEPHANPDLFTAQPAAGHHEVIVNAPDSVTALVRPRRPARCRPRWRRGASACAHTPDCACRHLIVNERREAGASLPHTHAQLYALRFVPAAIAREREHFAAYATRTMGGDLLGDLVQEEVRQRSRIVAIDDEAVAMAPYASRVPFQLMIAPRRSRARFEDDGPLGRRAAARRAVPARRRLGASPPLNLWVRTAPSGAEHFCWRIDILPRLTHLGGPRARGPA